QRARLTYALAASDPRESAEPMTDPILQILRTGSQTIRSPAIRPAGALRIPGAEDPLDGIARDTAQPASLRTEALRELVRRRPALGIAEMDFLLSQLSTTNAPIARLAAADVLTSAKLSSAQMVAFLKAARGDAVISPVSILGVVERDGLHAGSAGELLDYLAGSFDAGWTVSANHLTNVQFAIPEAQRVRQG